MRATSRLVALCAKLGESFSCALIDGRIRIRTHFLFPDGDVIDVYVHEQDVAFTVTDLGESLRWLRMQTAGQQITAKQRRSVSDVCVHHGVEVLRDEITVHVTALESLPAAIKRLAQASLYVAYRGL